MGNYFGLYNLGGKMPVEVGAWPLSRHERNIKSKQASPAVQLARG
jgi:hypothetical protein